MMRLAALRVEDCARFDSTWARVERVMRGYLPRLTKVYHPNTMMRIRQGHGEEASARTRKRMSNIVALLGCCARRDRLGRLGKLNLRFLCGLRHCRSCSTRLSRVAGQRRGAWGSDEAVFEGMNWSERYIEGGTRAGKLSRCQKSRTGRSRGRVEVRIMRVADPFCL